MKMKLIFLTLALGVSTCLLSAQDNNQRPGGGGPGGPGGPNGGPGGPGGPGGFGGPGGPRNSPIIESLDLNHDGVIDAEELAKASESLKKLDKNGDGKLTPDEYRPPRPGGPNGQGGPGGQGGPDGQNGPRRRGGPGGPGGPGGGQQHPDLDK